MKYIEILEPHSHLKKMLVKFGFSGKLAAWFCWIQECSAHPNVKSKIPSPVSIEHTLDLETVVNSKEIPLLNDWGLLTSWEVFNFDGFWRTTLHCIPVDQIKRASWYVERDPVVRVFLGCQITSNKNIPMKMKPFSGEPGSPGIVNNHILFLTSYTWIQPFHSGATSSGLCSTNFCSFCTIPTQRPKPWVFTVYIGHPSIQWYKEYK